MEICPRCASENIFFSKKRQRYFCEDCDYGFDKPAIGNRERIFISYGHDKNSALVAKIKDFLTEHNYDVWIDTSEIVPGSDWRERITNGIIGSNSVVSFLSNHAVRNSGVCLDELRIALCLKRAYITTMLVEPVEEDHLPTMVESIQRIDMANWANVPAEEWDDYFSLKMQELLDSLSSERAKELNREIELIQSKLSVAENMAKEQKLQRETLVGRLWLLDHYQAWLESDNSHLLAILGVPGSGKSAFSAKLVQQDPHVVASLFFEWDSSELRDPHYAIKLLAYKLAATMPDYRRMLISVLSDPGTEEILNDKKDASLLFDLLILGPMQCCIVGQRNRAVIVFDGLDETSPFFTDLIQRKAGLLPTWLKCVCTSRIQPDRSFSDKAWTTIRLDRQSLDNNEDLKTYFNMRLKLPLDDASILKLVDKCEGSFMYARSLCDALERQTMSLSNVDTLPAGINQFYREYFTRLFPSRSSYLQVRTLLELLSIEESVPESWICHCLNIDRYELWDLRYNMKSLIEVRESTFRDKKLYRFKHLGFVHKSIKDWLTDYEAAGEYWVNREKGYERLLTLVDSCPDDLPPIDQDMLASYRTELYGKLLILSGHYNDYCNLLLTSFDEASKNFRNYLAYYDLSRKWRWAFLLPEKYATNDIEQKLEEIVTYPHEFMVSEFAHRGLEAAALILKWCTVEGRYQEAFYRFMRQMRFAAYFRSAASDTVETRDGWDKYYLALFANVCLNQLSTSNVSVPDDVCHACNLLKISFNYYRGKPSAGMLGDYALLHTDEMFKDACILPNEVIEADFGKNADTARELQSNYNTESLTIYLSKCAEEDMQFIDCCQANGARLEEACLRALETLNGDSETRVKFIRKLLSIERISS